MIIHATIICKLSIPLRSQIVTLSIFMRNGFQNVSWHQKSVQQMTNEAIVMIRRLGSLTNGSQQTRVAVQIAVEIVGQSGDVTFQGVESVFACQFLGVEASFAAYAKLILLVFVSCLTSSYSTFLFCKMFFIYLEKQSRNHIQNGLHFLDLYTKYNLRSTINIVCERQRNGE